MVITSTESFFTFEKETFIRAHIGSKVSALARLTLGENLFNSQEKSVHCLHQWVSILSGLNLEKKAFPRDKENCCKAGFYCRMFCNKKSLKRKTKHFNLLPQVDRH